MTRPVPAPIAVLGIEEILFIDAEFRPAEPGAYAKYGLPAESAPCSLEPICISWKKWTTSEVSTLWYQPGMACPIPAGENVLLVCYQAPAEWSYYLAAGWELPTNIVDLYAEHRRTVNGKLDIHGNKMGKNEHKNSDGRTKYGLLAACEQRGVGFRNGVEKITVVTRILAGPPFSNKEVQEITDYNRDDVEDAEALFTAMLTKGELENLGQALLRGDSTRGFAVRDRNGLPVDCDLVERLKRNWAVIRANLARVVEDKHHYGVFSFDADGEAHFEQSKMVALIERLGMQTVWPKTDTGKYSFADPGRGNESDKTFKQMAQLNPYLEDLRQTKKLLEQFKVLSLPVSADGRCHGRYSPWVQATGRSSPGQGSIFAMPAWARWLIKPGEGRGIAYVDLKSAEFGIAAGLSHDTLMCEDYNAMLAHEIECVYFELAKRSNVVPPNARVSDYKPVRKLWKQACLAMMYGQSPEGLSVSSGISLSEARVIQSAFKKRYATYWAWTAREIVHAHARGWIETVCGWRLNVHPESNDGTLLNFPMQATCADIMRRAITLMADSGVAVCEIVHDAVMVEDAIVSLDETIAITKDCWCEASKEVLGFELQADCKKYIFPRHYEDDDGAQMWDVLLGLLASAENNKK